MQEPYRHSSEKIKIEFIDHDLDIDYPREMQRIQHDMQSLLADERKSQEELRAAFRAIGYEIE